MAVFTPVTEEDARSLLEQLSIGELRGLRGIQGGIENTNYFLDTTEGEWVLTLFERLSAEQLPFYLRLMEHLAQRGIPTPKPEAARVSGEILHTLCGKPAAVVQKLRGASQLDPQEHHCRAVGEMLARMHLAGVDFPLEQPNLRSLDWWNETAPVVLPFLDESGAALLRGELEHQNRLSETEDYAGLPRGAIHADLFRDNVMFEDSEQGQNFQRLTGFFDFYFAGTDTWLFDLAVCLNDWCIKRETGELIPSLSGAFIEAYEQVRPLSEAEKRLLPDLLCAAALRFWISRLWDFYLPREASVLQPHDPRHFERILRSRSRLRARSRSHLRSSVAAENTST